MPACWSRIFIICYTTCHSGEVIKPKPKNNVDTSKFATEAISDTNEKFEAILFDQQSQITYGHLYWDKNKSVGKITFEDGDNTDQISLQITDLSEIEPSERYSALLDGLYEAGIARFSMHEVNAISKQDSSKQAISSAVTVMSVVPRGVFDAVTPKALTNMYIEWPKTGITRTAHGWAFDPDRPSESVWVHFYGTGGDLTHKYIGAVLANKSRPDVNRAFGISGSHGWSTPVPEDWDIDGYLDMPNACITSTGVPFIEYACSVRFYAYAIDRTGDGPKRLNNNDGEGYFDIQTAKYQRP
jgi:hypothetical protein